MFPWRDGCTRRYSGDMNVKVRNFLLKSIPYLLSIAGGLIIFIVSADDIHNSNLNDLINNISASLLSIPLVFLLYDYSNYLISRRVNQTLVASMTARVNLIMAGLGTTLQNIAGIRQNTSWGEFERKLSARRVNFRRAKITGINITQITAARDQLDDIVYRIGTTGALNHGQVQTLTGIAHALTHIIDQHRFHGGRGAYVKSLDAVVMLMGDWYDSVGGVVAAPVPSVGNNANAS